jgi:hypothetical protein
VGCFKLKSRVAKRQIKDIPGYSARFTRLQSRIYQDAEKGYQAAEKVYQGAE